MIAPPFIPDHELLRLIGQGAYGEVWLARNVMGVMRAVKIIRRSVFEKEKPFEREFAAVKRYEPVSRAAAGLVNVLHAGRASDDSFFYYVMELADAADIGVDPAKDPSAYQPCTLRFQLSRLGRSTVGDCLEIAVSLAQGIAELHRTGLVHRDVKPSNIIFVGGKAKLADIGLVSDISESRSYVGTEGYVPPEGPGRPAGDIYGLGRVLYELSTGNSPHQFPSLPPAWAAQSSQEAFEFFEVVLKACEPSAELRYQTVDEMLVDLALLQSGQSVRQVRQLKGRIAWLKRAATVAAIVGLMAGIVAWWQRTEALAQRALVKRAELAEAAARRNLAQSLVEQARNARLSGRSEARFVALDLLEQARAMGLEDANLREEFISALVMPGLRMTKEFAHVIPGGVFDNQLKRRVYVDSQHSRLLLYDSLEDDGRSVEIAYPADSILPKVTPAPTAAVAKTALSLNPVGFESDGGLLVQANVQHLLRYRNGSWTCLTPADFPQAHWRLSPDGQWAVAWRIDKSIQAFHLQRQEWGKTWPCVFTSQPIAYAPHCVASTPDSLLVAITVQGRQDALVYDAFTGRLLAELGLSFPTSGAMALSADGSTVAVGGLNGELASFTLAHPECREDFSSGLSYFNSLSLSPDGRFLAASSWASVVNIWDLTDLTQITRVPLQAGMPQFSADGRRFNIDNGLRVQSFEVESGSLCRPLKFPKLNRTDLPIWAFTLHPRLPLFAAERNGSLLLVDTAKVERIHTWNIGAKMPRFSSDGSALVVTGSISLRVPITADSINNKAELGWPETIDVLPAQIRDALHDMSSDGNISISWSDTTMWRALRKGQPARRLPISSSASQAFCLNHDGRMLAHGWASSGIRVVDTQSSAVLRDLPSYGPWNRPLFSPVDDILIISSGIGLSAHETVGWTQLWHNSLGTTGATARFCIFDPSGRFLVTTPQLGTIALLEAKSGNSIVLLRRTREINNPILGWHVDGSILCEFDVDHQVLWRWDIATLRRFLRTRSLDWTDEPLPPEIPSQAPEITGRWLDFLNSTSTTLARPTRPKPEN